MIRIDAAFQDSATDPEKDRVAVNEYLVEAIADGEQGVLRQIVADQRVLPSLERSDAAGNTHPLRGTPLAHLRHAVFDVLSKASGCTHLNDAVRALAEAPVLLEEFEPHRCKRPSLPSPK